MNKTTELGSRLGEFTIYRGTAGTSNRTYVVLDPRMEYVGTIFELSTGVFNITKLRIISDTVCSAPPFASLSAARDWMAAHHDHTLAGGARIKNKVA